MSLLQKVYDTIKEKIEFVFFKRKFNSWYESKDIAYIDHIKDINNRIFEKLSKEKFDEAFWGYTQLQTALTDVESLKSFKQYVLNNENDEH